MKQEEKTEMLKAIIKVIDLDNELDLLDGDTFMKLVSVKDYLITKGYGKDI
tara:strand:- start:358 stop:510 length:153 start_codon:yes stop_codon:yes gene_type:complete